MSDNYPELPDFLIISQADRRAAWALWDACKAHGLNQHDRQLVRDVMAHHPGLTFDETYQHLREMGM